jgi:curli biogenesis system outer membrane secretion channel CsgG
MEFDNKTGTDYQISHNAKGTQLGNPIGNGMKEQMVTALMQTGQFIVLERSAVKDVLSEQEFGKSGAVKKETAAAVGEIEGAEFLIYGAVTEYLPSQASIAGGGAIDPLFGALGAGPGAAIFAAVAQSAIGAASASQDHIAIDIRLVDARTGRVVNATSVEGTPQDYSASLGGIFGSALLGVSAQVQTPIQKAVRACIIKAVNWIGDNALEYRKTVATTTPASQPQPKKSTQKRSVVKQESSPSGSKPEEKPKAKPEKAKSSDEWGQ